MEKYSIPDHFPKGTTFWDAEGIPFVKFPNGKWFNAYGGDLKPRTHLNMEGAPVTEEEWREVIADSIRSINQHRHL